MLFRLQAIGSMSKKPKRAAIKPPRSAQKDRRPRADAQRNNDSLLRSAMAVFAAQGVDAPIRDIAEQAGVGIGTVYRHFPQRSDLLVAVFRNEVDACADAAPALAAQHKPGEALSKWMQRYVDFIGAKRGLAAALHSGDPAYDALPAYFQQRLEPALRKLLNSAAASGEVRTDIAAMDLLGAVASLCMHAYKQGPQHARRMVGLLVDGLHHHPNPNRPAPI
jgi:AcrR family transcriptional regulator